MGPDIRTVEWNVDGNVAEKLDAFFPAIAPEVLPLTVKQVLLDLQLLYGVMKHFPKTRDFAGPSHTDL